MRCNEREIDCARAEAAPKAATTACASVLAFVVAKQRNVGCRDAQRCIHHLIAVARIEGIEK